MTKQQHDKIAQAIINNPQRSYTKLSTDLGCSRITVARVAKDAGITRPRGKKLNLIDKDAKEDFVWPLEPDPSGRFHDTCRYPNGRLSGRLIACDNPATTKIDGRSYCESHAGMVERGCLDTTVYEDGTTAREQMEARLEGRDPKPIYVYDSEADEWIKR
jgi:hypothetical protein